MLAACWAYMWRLQGRLIAVGFMLLPSKAKQYGEKSRVAFKKFLLLVLFVS